MDIRDIDDIGEASKAAISTVILTPDECLAPQRLPATKGVKNGRYSASHDSHKKSKQAV